MKFFVKKIYFTLFLLIVLLIDLEVLAKSRNVDYTKDNISNYFSGVILAKQGYNDRAFKYLKKVESLKNKHSKFNIEFVRTLILLERFKEAFTFAKSVWAEDEFFFEAEMLFLAHRLKMKIVEIPVFWKESKVSGLRILETSFLFIISIIKLKFSEIFGKRRL